MALVTNPVWHAAGHLFSEHTSDHTDHAFDTQWVQEDVCLYCDGVSQVADAPILIQWAIQAVGAEELAHRNVSDLSDGERQKVMMARALAQEPRMMVLDEITVFLDLPRRVEIMRLLRKLVRETNRAILLSTHDLDLALRSGDRIWLLPKGGTVQTGAPEDLVLNGAFEKAFSNEGVDFDRQQGAFRVHHAFRGSVNLVGEGILRYWTQRALEREGLETHHTDLNGSLHIEIEENGEGPVWRVTNGLETRQYSDLLSLTTHLRRIHNN